MRRVMGDVQSYHGVRRFILDQLSLEVRHSLLGDEVPSVHFFLK